MAGTGKVIASLFIMVSLAGCENAGFPGLSGNNPNTSNDSVTLKEREVEAPEVFQATDLGGWDGRQTLGGVWVAHPNVTAPEKAIIRDVETGKFVIGTVFSKDGAVGGPTFQMSSDAASALGHPIGATRNINVTALRREQVQVEPAANTSVRPTPAPLGVESIGGVATTPLPSTTPGGAIKPVARPTSSAPQIATPVASNLAKPFVQLGIFSIQGNATSTANLMSSMGLRASVLKESISGKTFWRVIAGPAQNQAELANILAKVKSQGFSDAYPVAR